MKIFLLFFIVFTNEVFGVSFPLNRGRGFHEGSCLETNWNKPKAWSGFYSAKTCSQSTTSSNFFSPKIQVRMQFCDLFSCYAFSKSLKDGQCQTWPGYIPIYPVSPSPLRICARVAMPEREDPLNPGKIISPDPGYTDWQGKNQNILGDKVNDPDYILNSGENLPKLCAYYDPFFAPDFLWSGGFDLFDYDPFKQTYHQTNQPSPLANFIISFSKSGFGVGPMIDLAKTLISAGVNSIEKITKSICKAGINSVEKIMEGHSSSEEQDNQAMAEMQDINSGGGNNYTASKTAGRGDSGGSKRDKNYEICATSLSFVIAAGVGFLSPTIGILIALLSIPNFSDVIFTVLDVLAKIFYYLGDAVAWIFEKIGSVNRLATMNPSTSSNSLKSSLGCVNMPLGPMPPPYCNQLKTSLSYLDVIEVCKRPYSPNDIQSTSAKPCSYIHDEAILSRNNAIFNVIKVVSQAYIPLCTNLDDASAARCVALSNFESALELHSGNQDIVKTSPPRIYITNSSNPSIDFNVCMNKGCRVIYSYVKSPEVEDILESYIEGNYDESTKSYYSSVSCSSTKTSECIKVWGISIGDHKDLIVDFKGQQYSNIDSNHYKISPPDATSTIATLAVLRNQADLAAGGVAAVVKLNDQDPNTRFLQESGQICAYVDPNNINPTLIGCKTRTPPPLPQILGCQYGKDDGSMQTSTAALDSDAISEIKTCETSYQDPQMIIKLLVDTNGTIDYTMGSIHVPTERNPQTDRITDAEGNTGTKLSNDKTIVNLAGYNFESYATDATFVVMPFSSIDPISKNSTPASPLEYNQGLYIDGGKFQCLTLDGAYNEIYDCSANSQYCVLAKLQNSNIVDCSIFKTKQSQYAGLGDCNSLCASSPLTSTGDIIPPASGSSVTGFIYYCDVEDQTRYCYQLSDGRTLDGKLCATSTSPYDRINPPYIPLSNPETTESVLQSSTLDNTKYYDGTTDNTNLVYNYDYIVSCSKTGEDIEAIKNAFGEALPRCVSRGLDCTTDGPKTVNGRDFYRLTCPESKCYYSIDNLDGLKIKYPLLRACTPSEFTCTPTQDTLPWLPNAKGDSASNFGLVVNDCNGTYCYHNFSNTVSDQDICTLTSSSGINYQNTGYINCDDFQKISKELGFFYLCNQSKLDTNVLGWKKFDFLTERSFVNLTQDTKNKINSGAFETWVDGKGLQYCYKYKDSNGDYRSTEICTITENYTPSSKYDTKTSELRSKTPLELGMCAIIPDQIKVDPCADLQISLVFSNISKEYSTDLWGFVNTITNGIRFEANFEEKTCRIYTEGSNYDGVNGMISHRPSDAATLQIIARPNQSRLKEIKVNEIIFNKSHDYGEELVFTSYNRESSTQNIVDPWGAWDGSSKKVDENFRKSITPNAIIQGNSYSYYIKNADKYAAPAGAYKCGDPPTSNERCKIFEFRNYVKENEEGENYRADVVKINGSSLDFPGSIYEYWPKKWLDKSYYRFANFTLDSMRNASGTGSAALIDPTGTNILYLNMHRRSDSNNTAKIIFFKLDITYKIE